ncbi:MAG TPA: hypothetical protein P5277_01550 [Candidatus Paceibacterota bacterium]|nr:hypothetical protein [Candidatus Paceibacterota bacterium]
MKTKILVVEDMDLPLEALNIAIRLSVLREPKPIELSGDSQRELEERGIDVVRTLEEARNYVEKSLYDLVLLDHNLPARVGSPAEDIGYTLIPKIKERNPETYIVGTSSNDRLPSYLVPDCAIRKSSMTLDEDIGNIYDKLERRYEQK